VEFFTLILFIISAYFVYQSVKKWKTHNEIKNKGEKGYGRLLSCKRAYYTKWSFLIPHYEPIIEFIYADQTYRLRAMGRFMLEPIIAHEVGIVYYEKYPDNVVIIRKEKLIDRFIIEVMFYLLICIVLVLIGFY